MGKRGEGKAVTFRFARGKVVNLGLCCGDFCGVDKCAKVHDFVNYGGVLWVDKVWESAVNNADGDCTVFDNNAVKRFGVGAAINKSAPGALECRGEFFYKGGLADTASALQDIQFFKAEHCHDFVKMMNGAVCGICG